MSARSYQQRLLLQLLARKRSSGQGFTLIELLVVIVILGVLGAAGYQAYLNQIQRANAATAQNVAVAAAKNCAALRITEQTGDWVDGIVNSSQVSLTGTCNASGQVTFQAQAGTGTNAGTGRAILQANGAVTD